MATDPTAMTQRMIGIMFVVFVLVAGAYAAWETFGRTPDWYAPVQTEAPGRGIIGAAGRDEDAFDITITYTDAGFSTTSIAVKKGTRVRFLNASSGATWPASGIHPTHTLYPEKEETDCLGSSFDSCRSLEPGEYFDFTFNYTGQWPFHDHVHGYHSGTIIVE